MIEWFFLNCFYSRVLNVLKFKAVCVEILLIHFMYISYIVFK